MTLVHKIYKEYHKTDTRNNQTCYVSYKNFAELYVDAAELLQYASSVAMSPNYLSIVTATGDLLICPSTYLTDEEIIVCPTEQDFEKYLHNKDFSSKIGELLENE